MSEQSKSETQKSEQDQLIEPREKGLTFRVNAISEKQPESGERKNEDAYVVYEDDNVLVAAVLDGATSLSAITGVGNLNEQGGLFAAQTGARGIEENATDAKSADELLIKANERIANELLARGEKAEEKSALELSNSQAVVVRIDKRNKTASISLLGDAACLIKHKDGTVELALPLDITPEDNEALQLVLDASRKDGVSVAEIVKSEKHRKRVNSILIKGRERCNSADGGVGVLDGRSSAAAHIRSIELPMADVSEIILLTDGLFLPSEKIGDKPDWEKTMEILDKEGIDGLYKKVLDIKNSDPSFNKYPRLKKHDDATGILIKCESFDQE